MEIIILSIVVQSLDKFVIGLHNIISKLIRSGFRAESDNREIVALLKQEVRKGTIFAATEQHLWREFAAVGWEHDPSLDVEKLIDEVQRQEAEAQVLRERRDAALGQLQAVSPDA